MSFKLSVSRTLDGASSPEATQQTFYSAGIHLGLVRTMYITSRHPMN